MSSDRITTRRGQRGFTFAELMVSVTVMAFLAVIALPNATTDHERKLDMLQLQLQKILIPIHGKWK